MADGSPQTFSSWDQVSGQYGSAVSDQLQALNVPLSEVGQLAQQYGAGFSSIGSLQGNGQTFVPPGFGAFGASSGQQTQQGPPPGTIQLSGAQDPAYASNLLGAQALQAVGLNPSKSMTVNQQPGPGGTPANSNFAQSGVTPVSGPMNFDISKMATPNINPQIGSVFNAVQPLKPTVSGPQPTYTNPGPWEQRQVQKGLAIQPAAQPTGAQASTGVPFATPPSIPTIQTPQVSAQLPSTPGTLPPAPSAPSGTPAANYAAPNPGAVNHPFVPSPRSGGAAIATQTSIPRMQEGGVATDPTVAMVGDAGPEAIVPITNDNWPYLQTQIPSLQNQGGPFDQMPTSQSNAVQQWPLTQMSNYQGAQQPPAAPAPTRVAPPARPANPLQQAVAPQTNQATSPGTQAYALATGTQVGPPNPPQQNNQVSDVAQAAAHSAINNVLQKNNMLEKMRPLLSQAQQTGASLEQFSRRPMQTVQNAVPSPDDFKKRNNSIYLTGANQGFA